MEPEPLLSMTQRLGLAGLGDCSTRYFLVNLSALLTLVCGLIVLLVLINYPRGDSWGDDIWQGRTNDSIPCEALQGDEFLIQQVVNAISSYAYVAVGGFIAVLASHDMIAWEERYEEERTLLPIHERNLELAFGSNARAVVEAANRARRERLSGARRNRGSGSRDERRSNERRSNERRREERNSGNDQVQVSVVPLREDGGDRPRRSRSRERGSRDRNSGDRSSNRSGARDSSRSGDRSSGNRTSTGSRGDRNSDRWSNRSAISDRLSIGSSYNKHVVLPKGSPALVVRQPAWSVFLAITVTFLGVCGFLYHSSLTVLAKRLDAFSWWCVLINFIAYSWARLFSDGLHYRCINVSKGQRSSRFLSILFISLALAADVGMYLYLELLDETGLAQAVLIGLLFLFAVPMFSHWYLRSAEISSMWSMFILAFLFGIGGYLLYQNDLDPALCNPESYAQPHAFWHLFSAIALLFLALFFRSDFWTDEAIENMPFEIVSGPPPDSSAERDRVRSLEAPRAQSPPRDSSTQRRSGNDDLIPAVVVTQDERTGEVVKRRMEEAGAGDRGSRRSGGSGGASAPERRWTCSNCHYMENHLEWENCARCNNARPPLEAMTAVPMRRSGDRNSGNRNSGGRNSGNRNSGERRRS